MIHHSWHQMRLKGMKAGTAQDLHTDIRYNHVFCFSLQADVCSLVGEMTKIHTTGRIHFGIEVCRERWLPPATHVTSKRMGHSTWSCGQSRGSNEGGLWCVLEHLPMVVKHPTTAQHTSQQLYRGLVTCTGQLYLSTNNWGNIQEIHSREKNEYLNWLD